MKYIKKYWLIITLIIITIIRFLMSYNLPTYYFKNLGLDDGLMLELSDNLLNGKYLGNYTSLTLTKGFIFPLFIAFSKLTNISYSILLTIIYIISCIIFTKSLKGILNNKLLIILYIVLLFNPISYSIELFQRLYRNSLSISETLLFFAFIINIIKNNNLKKNILNYIFLGIITSIMYLTREDNIWSIIILILLFLYKFFKNKNIKSFLINLTPITTLYLILNIISFINYKYYGIYTYNELSNSSFKDCYIKILEIKDNKKINQISITKDTLIKLSQVSKYFDISTEDIERLYNVGARNNYNEITNDDIFWHLRELIYGNKLFKNGSEANLYFKNLSLEIDELFESGKLEKELVIPSVLINTPTLNDLKMIPSSFLDIITYTSSYKNIRTASLDKLKELPLTKYSNQNKSYYTYLTNRITNNNKNNDSNMIYKNIENIITENIKSFEIIRIIYKYLTIILSIISLIIYIFNIKNLFNKNMFINSLILITYLIIIFGVSITNVTGFYAIRYYYLGNVYILQNIFIILSLNIIINKKIKE